MDRMANIQGKRRTQTHLPTCVHLAAPPIGCLKRSDQQPCIKRYECKALQRLLDTQVGMVLLH